MRLAELEREFWNAVRTRGGPPPELDRLFTGSDKQTATERLAVYHVAYWHRQLAALSATFPRTRAVLLERFERLVFGYIEARPCSEPVIERLGAGFSDYLAEQADISETALGVARLEWAGTAALLAPNPRAVQTLPRDLGAGLAECRLELVPSLHVVHVTQAALALLDGAEPMDDSTTIDVAFYRPEHAVQRSTLASDGARALSLAAGGATIAVICTTFAAMPEAEAVLRARDVLGAWFSRGWVSRCAP